MFSTRSDPTAPTVKTVGAKEAYEEQQSRNAVIVDVREPAEWAESRIPGAVLIPLAELAYRVKELPRDRPVIMQCRSGNRSRVATEFLLGHGFPNVRNLVGGIVAWAACDLPLEP